MQKNQQMQKNMKILMKNEILQSNIKTKQKLNLLQSQAHSRINVLGATNEA